MTDYVQAFPAFLRAAYFRILFVAILLVPLHFTCMSLLAIWQSEPLAEYIKDFSNIGQYRVINVKARLVSVICADLLLILASALFFQLMRSFLQFNTKAILQYIEDESDGNSDTPAVRLGGTFAWLFQTLITAYVAIILIVPHFGFVWTLLARTSEPPAALLELTPTKLAAMLSAIRANDLRAISMMITLGAISLYAGMIVWIVRTGGRFLEARTLHLLSVVVVTALAVHVTVFMAPVESAALLGPFSIIMLFQAVIITVLAAFLYRHALLPLVGFALAIWSGNLVYGYSHTRELPPESTPASTTRSYAQDFACRFSETGSTAPIPIFIVTAEGGGLYAAYFSATMLARLVEWQPRLADHILAMSGVSGGGLGVTLFSKALQHDRQKHRAIILDYFKFDFLSPLVASLAFVDSRQLIGASGASRHRAFALERAFEVAWEQAVKLPSDATNEFATNFLRLNTREIPIVINAVVINNGVPLLISPLQLSIEEERRLNPFENYRDLVGPDHALRASTAVGLGARFPYATPTGILPLANKTRGTTISVGDGGYFDNTGMATGLMLADEFMTAAQAPATSQPACNPKRFKMVFLRLRASVPISNTQKFDVPPDELLAPLIALYNVRTAQRDQLSHIAQQKSYQIVDLPLFETGDDLPLTWHLSVNNKTWIDSRTGALASRAGKEIDELLRRD